MCKRRIIKGRYKIWTNFDGFFFLKNIQFPKLDKKGRKNQLTFKLCVDIEFIVEVVEFMIAIRKFENVNFRTKIFEQKFNLHYLVNIYTCMCENRILCV